MLNKYLALLIKELRTAKKVKAYSQLNAAKWTKSCFFLLSKIIGEELGSIMTHEQCLSIGTTISPRTLQKMTNGEYQLRYPIDPRVLNTLNKLVIFLGAKDWDDFIGSRNIEVNPKKGEPENELEMMIHKALNETFLCYQSLPNLKELDIGDYFMEGQAAHKKIVDLLVQKNEDNTIISNPFNPSTFEILDLQVKKQKEGYAQVVTKEYWLLCWWDTTKERYVHRYKNISKHYYILQKIEGKWKIKTDATTSDIIKISKKKRKKKVLTKLRKAV